MAIQHTTEQLAQLSSTVADLAHNLTATAPPSLTLPQGLRLPNLVLPHYTGKENLDRFIEQLETILKSSGVPSKFWVTYLKQQTQKDPRADVICATDKENQATLGRDVEKCLPSEFQPNAVNHVITSCENCWAPTILCANKQMKVWQILPTVSRRHNINWRNYCQPFR